jgi:hypothetical protein
VLREGFDMSLLSEGFDELIDTLQLDYRTTRAPPSPWKSPASWTFPNFCSWSIKCPSPLPRR